MFGTITSCKKNQVYESLLFTVTMNSGHGQEYASQNIEIASEEDIWGGFMAYKKKSGQRLDTGKVIPPFYRTYIVPTPMLSPRYNESTWVPVLAFQVGNYRSFKLEARDSNILNAGLGLFVTCTLTSPSSKQVFELPEGTIIDLGVYATSTDSKDGCISLLKNFIHGWTPESWSFEGLR